MTDSLHVVWHSDLRAHFADCFHDAINSLDSFKASFLFLTCCRSFGFGSRSARQIGAHLTARLLDLIPSERTPILSGICALRYGFCIGPRSLSQTRSFSIAQLHLLVAPRWNLTHCLYLVVLAKIRLPGVLI